MDIIELNPYRILGIYSNSSLKDRLANKNKLKAFIKIGKSVSFPLDLEGLLSTINRTTEMVGEAESKVILPIEQIKYAQFWFMKSTPIDEIAMNHLISGNIDMALSIWEKQDNASSLQNRIVISLIRKNYSVAISCAEKLCSEYKSEFINNVLGNITTIETNKIEYNFLDELLSLEDSKKFLPFIKNTEWSKYLKGKNVQPLIDELNEALKEAKDTRGENPLVRLEIGEDLISDTKEALIELKGLLGESDLQYQMIADKIGLEILQCGIDYYNGSDDRDAAYNAQSLQNYALSIVEGKIAKDRCLENIKILNDIISTIPPKDILNEFDKILEELDKAKKQHDEIIQEIEFEESDKDYELLHGKTNSFLNYSRLNTCVEDLLKNTEAIFQNIRNHVGCTNKAYLKYSDLVVNYSLNVIIELVNRQQKIIHQGLTRGYLKTTLDDKIGTASILIPKALDILRSMKKFDMGNELSQRYSQNLETLNNISHQITQLSLKMNPPKDDSEISGCLWFLIVIFIIIIIGAMS